MKNSICAIILILSSNLYAQSNFDLLARDYEAASQPSVTDLTASNWIIVKTVSDYSLEINKGFHDQIDDHGIKNHDGSQMVWKFVQYNIPGVELTLTKRNFLDANRNSLLNRVKLQSESRSIVYAFSAYPDANKNDIYYVQNCRISNLNRLLCPVTLKMTDEAAIQYPLPSLLAARNKVMAIQEFKSNLE